MKKIQSNIKVLAALLIAGAAFSACTNSDDDIIQAVELATVENQVYTMTVEATKGGSQAMTRALAESGSKIVATWGASDKVQVWSTDNEHYYGELTPSATGGQTTSLTGDLSVPADAPALAADSQLQLKFCTGSSTYQGGTLSSIAANEDVAEATVTIASVTDNGGKKQITTTGAAAFVNKRAIVKFSLKTSDGNSDISAHMMQVNVDGLIYVLKPGENNPQSVYYLSVPATSNKTVILTAFVKNDSETLYYRYTNTGVSFEAGKFYPITVKMPQTTQSGVPVSCELSASEIGYIVGSNGKAYIQNQYLPSGVTAVAMVAYKNGTNGLAIALSDEKSGEKNRFDWNTAVNICNQKNTDTPVTGGTWRLTQKVDWVNMCTANGNYKKSVAGLNKTLTNAVGSSSCVAGDEYWTKTENYNNSSSAYSANFFYMSYTTSSKTYEYRVRAVFAF